RFCNFTESPRVLTEEVAADVGLGGLDRVQQPLIFRQVADELQDQRRVGRRGHPHLHLLPKRGLGLAHAGLRLPSPMTTPGGGRLSSGTKKSAISCWVGSTRYL